MVGKASIIAKTAAGKNKNARPIILIGHSLGGTVIARMTMDSPELVDGVVMVAPSIDPEIEP
ncbi:MAG TPA: alpha/beta hydrolase [Cyclobacteriaceae bacterium]